MPRPRGPHGRDESTVVAVRVPNGLLQHMRRAAGAPNGQQFAEWHRNVLRQMVRVPINYEAGYEEGKAAGWAEAQARFRDALRGAGE